MSYWYIHVVYLRRREDGSDIRLQRALAGDAVDSKFGFDRYKEAKDRTGWLINMHPVSSLKRIYFNKIDISYLGTTGDITNLRIAFNFPFRDIAAFFVLTSIIFYQNVSRKP